LRQHFLIIRNPLAGAADPRRFDATLSALRQAGARLEVVATARHGDARQAAADAVSSGRFDAIIAAGGDGTVHDVVDALVGQPIPLGIIPLGTANVFARELNLPRTPDALANMLIRGTVEEIHVGQVNERPFLFVVGIGFDAEAVHFFAREGNRKLGRAGLFWPVAHALLTDRDRPLRVTTAQGESEAQWVIATRIKHYAGNLLLAPDADLRQPFLHLLRMKGTGWLSRIPQLASFTIGQPHLAPATSIERVDWARIEGDPAVPVQIDGEALGELPLYLRLHPQKLLMILP